MTAATPPFPVGDGPAIDRLNVRSSCPRPALIVEAVAPGTPTGRHPSAPAGRFLMETAMKVWVVCYDKRHRPGQQPGQG